MALPLSMALGSNPTLDHRMVPHQWLPGVSKGTQALVGHWQMWVHRRTHVAAAAWPQGSQQQERSSPGTVSGSGSQAQAGSVLGRSWP